MRLFTLATLCAYVGALDVRITDLGAVGDNATLCTAALLQALHTVSSAGGGNVIVPYLNQKPDTYVIGAVNLTSNINLVVEHGATLRGAADTSLFPIVAPLPSYGTSRDTLAPVYARHQPILWGLNQTNITISGGGTIDGSGSYWWTRGHAGTLAAGRPHLVEFQWSEGIEVREVSIENSPFWTLHFVYSKNIWVHDVNIYAPADSPNTDGIDPDSAQNVLIEHCTIDCGDDFIAIKSGINEAGLAYGMPSQNITVQHNTFIHGHGISLGSEVSGGISDIFVYNNSIDKKEGTLSHGLHIKTAATRGAYVKNVHFKDNTLLHAKVIIGIDTTYPYEGTLVAGTPLTDITNITYEHVTADYVDQAGSLICFADRPCTDITFTGGISVQDYNSPAWVAANVETYKVEGAVSPSGLEDILYKSMKRNSTV